MDLISRMLISPLAKFLFRIKHKGLEALPKDENFIFAMNHQSALEIIAMPVITMRSRDRKLSILIEKKAYDNPIVGIWLRMLDSIRVDRSPEGDRTAILNEAASRLAKGNDILIFPEGDVFGGDIGKIQRAKTGAVRLAILSKKKIVPVGIAGSYRAWKFPVAVSQKMGYGTGVEKVRYQPKFPKIPVLSFVINFFEGDRRRVVRIRFGKPIDLSKVRLNLEKRTERTRRTLRKFTNNLMRRVASLSGAKYFAR